MEGLRWRATPGDDMAPQNPGTRRLRDDSVDLMEALWMERVEGAEPVSLPLTLHERYDRHDIFKVFGVDFDQRQRHLIAGLSPKLRDGGYCIFITLNKESFEDAYDYDDELFSDRLRWVTRRDRDEDHPDYVAAASEGAGEEHA